MPISLTSRSSNNPKAADLPPSDALALARTQARRRLLGALMLLALGVATFAALFETQPRPRSGAAPVVVMPAGPPTRMAGPGAAAEPPAAAPESAPPAPPAPAARAAVAVLAPSAVPAVSATKPVTAPSATPVGQPGKQVEQQVEQRVAQQLAQQAAQPAPNAAPTTATHRTAPAAVTAPPKAGRFVVQVGAYADVDTLKQSRLRVERLGLKTYIQQVDTAGGKRTRVRVGPFPTRAEAQRAVSKLKSSGFNADLLEL